MADPWEPQIEFTQERARELIESQFPELAPVSLASFGQGWDNLALLANGEWVFRFPQRDLARDLMGYECVSLRHIAGRLPLTVPEPVFVGQPAGDYPYPFSGYRILRGETSCQRTLSDEQRLRSAGPLGAFLRALHDTPLDAEMLSAVPTDLIRRADLDYRLTRTLEALDEVEARGASLDFPALGALAKELAQTGAWDGEPRLVHGDLYARHLIVDEEGLVTGVIDWGDVHRGDPALDLSIQFGFLPARARTALVEAYGEIDSATQRRARFKAINHGILLVNYGMKVEDREIARAGEWALGHLLEE